jgi:Lar family restriction alleviation protein
MSIELKPCPFCGEYPSVDEYATIGGRVELVRIACSHAAHTAEVIGSPEFASKEWNTRAERTCKAANVAEYAWDDFECSECGWVTWNFLMEHVGCGTVCKPRYCPNCGAKVVE